MQDDAVADRARQAGKLKQLNRQLSKDMPLVLASLCFVVFPVALSNFDQIEAGRQLSIVGFACVLWMAAVLMGIRSIPDILVGDDDGAVKRLRLRRLLQAIFFAVGAVLLRWA